LVLDSIEKIEIALRTQIIYHLCIDHGRNWFENPTIFKKDQHAKLIEDIDKEINRTNEVFIKEYKNKYTSPTRPPAWMTIEVTPIGLLSRIFSSLQDKLPAKKTIGSFWGIDSIVLQNWIYSICYVRNICAHHGRLWNRSLNPNIKIPKKCEDKWLSSTPNVNNKLYLFLAMKTYLLRRLSDKTEFVNKFQNLLHKYPQIDIKQMGFSDDWQKDSFWMCPM
jgi:abortive infection bacteriophage resistance protein